LKINARSNFGEERKIKKGKLIKKKMFY